MPPNYNLAQSNYYTKMNDSASQIKVKYQFIINKHFRNDSLKIEQILTQLLNKAVKSSSYSPVKTNKGFRRTENKFMYNQKDDEYKDDDYLWFKTDMNQTQEHISTYSAISKKNKRQRFLEKSEKGAKSFNLSKNNTRCV